MYEYITLELFFLHDVIPSVPAFYYHSIDAYCITENIIDSIQLFKTQEVYYLDNITYNVNELVDCHLYLDNQYWNSWWYHKRCSWDNHIVWNCSNSPVSYNKDTCNLWFRLYILNIDPDSYLWLSEDKSIFKTRLHDFGKSKYDIQYIHPRRYKHHDYNNDIYVCTTSFWQQYLHTKTVTPGFFLFWYENFGCVEVPVKAVWTYWYQVLYPSFEMFVALDPNSRIHDFQNVFSASFYYEGLTKMILNYKKDLHTLHQLTPN